MNATTLSSELRALAPGLARRLAPILAGLQALVAARWLHRPAYTPLIVPLWGYIARTLRRFERLMTRLAAGRQPRPHRPTMRPDRVRQRPPVPLPSGAAWLIEALPNEAACFAGQLESLLAEPGHAELIAASPAAQRILRTLRRALGTGVPQPRRPRPLRRVPTPPPAQPGPITYTPPPPAPRRRRTARVVSTL